MVTLRRDIAAKMEMGAMGETMGLNAYDALIREKRRAAASSYETPSYFSSDVSECFRSPENSVTEEETKPRKARKTDSSSKAKSYEDYMLEVLHRTSNDRPIMTQTEYEREVLGITGKAEREEISKDSDTAVGKLTKGGKIFVGIYVLLIAVVAFVLIAVNTFAKQSPAMAGTESDPDAVEAMTIESETSSGNWFDKLCDAISAK